MRDLIGRVAVVTGAGGGIGRSVAGRLAEEGMKVVLADVERDALQVAADELTQQGHDVLAVPTDVSSADDVEQLAAQTLARYGKVHLLCNIAGVTRHAGDAVWESTLADWRWLLEVNLWGTIHGLRSFVPILLSHGEEGYVVNTSSVGGLVAGGGAYGATKHAVSSLTESLYFDLRARGSTLGVSLLCPGFTATRIVDAARNRPSRLTNPNGDSVEQQASLERFARLHAERGVTTTRVADVLVAAIRERRFYVFVDVANPAIRTRAEDIELGRDPSPR